MAHAQPIMLLEDFQADSTAFEIANMIIPAFFRQHKFDDVQVNGRRVRSMSYRVHSDTNVSIGILHLDIITLIAARHRRKDGPLTETTVGHIKAINRHGVGDRAPVMLTVECFTKDAEGFISNLSNFLREIPGRYIGQKPMPIEQPSQPRADSPMDQWIEYYHAVKAAGMKISFNKISKLSGYQEGSLRNRHEGCQNELCRRRPKVTKSGDEK